MYNRTWRKSQRLGKGQKEEGRTAEEGREKLEIVNHKKDIYESIIVKHTIDISIYHLAIPYSPPLGRKARRNEAWYKRFGRKRGWSWRRKKKENPLPPQPAS